jgi:hypothetical protein
VNEEQKESEMLSPAAKKYKKTALSVMVSYFVLFPVADYVAVKVHPAGAGRVLLALLPLLPIAVVLVLTGRYLREEKDGYKRDLAVRCLLWGTAGAVMVNLFSGYLRIFGWKGQLFPFTEFFVFTLMMIAAKLSYRVANRIPEDE